MFGLIMVLVFTIGARSLIASGESVDRRRKCNARRSCDEHRRGSARRLTSWMFSPAREKKSLPGLTKLHGSILFISTLLALCREWNAAHRARREKSNDDQAMICWGTLSRRYQYGVRMTFK